MPSTGTPSPAALILAAGRGTRMKSRYPKAVHRLLGKPMARYAVDLCRGAGAERVLLVVGHQADVVRETVGGDVEYVEQAEQNGTGHAVAAAHAALADHDGLLLVIQADTVLISPEDVAAIVARQAETGAAATLLTSVVDRPATYGRVVRSEDGAVQAIVEAKGASPEVLAIQEINVGAYAFQSRALFTALRETAPDPTTGEIYLTEVVRLLVQAGERVETVDALDPAAALGVNDRVELAHAVAILRARTLHRHMCNGVTVEDPASTFIDSDVEIGADTIIRPMTFLCGATVIGEECEIGPQARITDCTLGARVSVQNAVLAQSQVADETRIGPFAQLRPGCKIGRKVKIGNFVELKNAEVEDRASIGHLAYVADAFVGEKSNIGAGTITCNYDGKNKHRTRIGRGSFIGSHTTLVAPVSIGDGGFTAAGTVVTQDVPEDALAIGRVKASIKEEWAKKRRERGG